MSSAILYQPVQALANMLISPKKALTRGTPPSESESPLPIENERHSFEPVTFLVGNQLFTVNRRYFKQYSNILNSARLQSLKQLPKPYSVLDMIQEYATICAGSNVEPPAGSEENPFVIRDLECSKFSNFLDVWYPADNLADPKRDKNAVKQAYIDTLELADLWDVRHIRERAIGYLLGPDANAATEELLEWGVKHRSFEMFWLGASEALARDEPISDKGAKKIGHEVAFRLMYLREVFLRKNYTLTSGEGLKVFEELFMDDLARMKTSGSYGIEPLDIHLEGLMTPSPTPPRRKRAFDNVEADIEASGSGPETRMAKRLKANAVRQVRGQTPYPN